jgi:acyl-CoA thioesterase FadM
MGMPAATTIAIMVRCPDINAIVHVTNAMFATYLDTLLTTAPTVLASLRIDHHAPITLGDAERVRYAVEWVGHSAIPMALSNRADGTD